MLFRSVSVRSTWSEGKNKRHRAVRPTSKVTSRSDVVEGRRSSQVDERVDEIKRELSMGDNHSVRRHQQPSNSFAGGNVLERNLR